MEQSILEYPKQFAYHPEISNSGQLIKRSKFIILGMGGSHLAAGLVKAIDPTAPILIHWDYGLPDLSDEELKDYLIVACSYSGNTEEVIDGLNQAMAKSLAVTVIATGGKLLDQALNNGLSHIKLPTSNIQPRLALGFFLKALALVMDRSDILEAVTDLSQLDPAPLETPGEQLAEQLAGHIPMIYSSRTNSALAYNWKIKFNETSKTPAFYNIVPELNHNEMTGFDQIQDGHLPSNFSFIFITDPDDDPRITKRFEVLAKLYRDRNLSVTEVALDGPTRLHRLFNNLILADWTALALAKQYGHEPEQVPMVEEFKGLIARNS